MLELVLRLGFSLAAVLGLFWVVARYGSRRLGGGSRAVLHVRARHSLSRAASIAVVEVGDRVLVVGVSDGGVRLLTELDPASLPAPTTTPASVPAVDPSLGVAIGDELDASPLPAAVREGARPATLTDRLAVGLAVRLRARLDARRSARASSTASAAGTTPGGGHQGPAGSASDAQTWEQAWEAATTPTTVEVGEAPAPSRAAPGTPCPAATIVFSAPQTPVRVGNG